MAGRDEDPAGPSTVAATTTSGGSEAGTVPNQLATLVPSCDPSKDDLEQYTQKVELLCDVWPSTKYNELVTRLILQCTGTAFQKLSLHRTELLSNEKKSIQKLVQLLGGHWGKIGLETKYEAAERALFRCQQRPDETNDSFLARADVYWSDLLSKGMGLSELQAYIVLRGSLLTGEDKKKVLIERNAAETGKLTLEKVTQSVRMLGAGFFHDITGQKKQKGKTYESTALTVDSGGDADLQMEGDQPSTMFAAGSDEVDFEDFIADLANNGDEDAVLLADFEAASCEVAQDAIQEDADLTAAFTAYTDARRRLGERFRNRGFWPINPSLGKGKGKGNSGRGKGKGSFGSFGKGGQRKTIQQRMLETNGRICFKKGHWKAECPERFNRSQSSQATTQPQAMVSNAKKTHAEVKLTQLTPAEKEEFKKAKQTEIQSWLKTGTVGRILRSQLQPEQIIRCRWILTWKALDPTDVKKDAAGNPIRTHKAKARLVVLGYLDPEIETIPRDSPTLKRHSRNLLLQLIASKGWLIKSFDVKAAFLQGQTQDGRCLAVEPAQEFREILQLTDQEVLKFNKSAYGLIDAPFLWYQELNRTLQSLGFRQSPFDPCLYILFNEAEKTIDGILGMHVDDGICGGNSRFESKLDALEKKFSFGSKKVQTFNFTGIEVHQNSEGQIQMSQKNYVNKINPIKVSAQRKANPEAEITDEERHELRALIGSLQYAAVNTRPDLSSRLSYLQSEINRGKVSTLVDANKVLHEAKTHSDVKIVFQPIKMEDLRFLAFSDASFASKKNPESHAGQIILATHKDISLNYSCPISALAWGCKKIQKVVVSTLAAETMSLSSTLDQLSWMRLFWAWFVDPSIDWKHPKEALQKIPQYVSTTTVAAQRNAQSIAVTDCKSLFDLVTRTAPPNCQEFRTALQAKAIKDLLSEGVALRWVHSGAQLADSLTKIMENKFLRYTLQTGRYRLNDELQTLKERADSRSRITWLNRAEKTE